jgi:hypothetical protein
VEYHELNDDQMAEARAEALTRILEDGSARKLVVAGPGTGKTYAFQRLLARSDGANLALTFLTGLVGELEKALGDTAEVYGPLMGVCPLDATPVALLAPVDLASAPSRIPTA